MYPSVIRINKLARILVWPYKEHDISFVQKQEINKHQHDQCLLRQQGQPLPRTSVVSPLFRFTGSSDPPGSLDGEFSCTLDPHTLNPVHITMTYIHSNSVAIRIVLFHGFVHLTKSRYITNFALKGQKETLP